MSVQAADWVGAEKAIHRWAWQSAGIAPDRVRSVVDRDLGEAKGPAPKATIQLISCVPVSQPGQSVAPQVMRQRYRVVADGPGEAGVDFYPGTTLTPTRISVAAGPGDPPATIAAALLIELAGSLPAGYSASLDPDDSTAVLVDGSVAQPLFAARSANDALVEVTTPIPRYPILSYVECRLVWRITFRSSSVSAAPTQAATETGPRFAADMMTRAMAFRHVLDRYMRPLGFRHNGTPSSQPSIPTDRSESTAALDVAFVGLLTGLEATTAIRAVGFEATAA